MSDTGKTIALIKALAPAPEIDPEEVKADVEEWLEDHPEATTTVEDGAITKAKLNASLQGTVDDVDALKSAIQHIDSDNVYRGDDYFLTAKDFELGALDGSFGVPATSTTRMRTITFLNIEHIDKIVAPSEQLFLLAYKNTAEEYTQADFVGGFSGTEFGSGMGAYLEELDITAITSVRNFKYALVIRKADNSDITDIAELLNSLTITYKNQSVTLEQSLIDIEERIEAIDSPINLPFTLSGITANIYKLAGKYVADINTPKIKKTNGAVAFISPNGLHDNDGLSVNTPVKTINEALSVPNVETVIFLPGTYNANTHFFVGNAINTSVNIIGIGEVIVDNLQGQNNTPITINAPCYVKNIHFRHGNNTLKANLGSGQIVVFEDCIFSDSDDEIYSNGLAVLGGSAYVINCKAYNNAFDGFNYHENDNIPNYAIEVNCESYNNGNSMLSADAGQSSNATTTHDGSYIVRVNGNYYACHGGIIADLNAHSANYGCKAGISTVTDVTNYADRMSNYWASGTEMYLYDCESYGSKYDTAKLNGGSIISNVTYPSNYTDE